MPSYNLTIKWGKEVFQNISLDTESTPEDFKAQLYALTNVPIERQKVMFPKGGMLKDNSDWSKFGLKDGLSVMLVGTADDKLPEKPTEAPVFIEDGGSVQDLASLRYPPGIQNLGNTCYLNSTLQVLHHIPELRTALKKFSKQNGSDDQVISQSFKELFSIMKPGANTVIPITFLSAFKRIFPQFAQKTPEGYPMQQDAEECFSTLVKSLKAVPALTEGQENAINELFEGEIISKTKCLETELEQENVSVETFSKLPCHITNDTNFLVEGIERGLAEQISKHSNILGQDAVFQKESAIKRLPFYLTIQFVRFWWNQKAGVKAKINRPIDFPNRLDVYKFCTPDLQEKLRVVRNTLLEEENKKILESKGPASSSSSSSSSSAPSQDPSIYFSDPDTIPTRLENNTGYYELVGIITHKGRMADSGHYVAWVHDHGDNWILYDDDTVHEVKADSIRDLTGKGGADWHIAYICVYRSVYYEVKEEKSEDVEMAKPAEI
eukprot:TRINITY_DN898_c1_g1_i1.p1 TRINITY_DN898_c1_g1~~TRINITY_DN898_c1_g1_i1.p1  ORF type:complete len:515 (+),score=294.94 TRINITY_DN898_c1_g1_i1:64-1545(+)